MIRFGMNGNATYLTRLGGITGTPSPVPTLNVKDYGAVGDGTTANDTAFAAAGAAMSAAGGGVVLIPEGTWRLTATFAHQWDGVHFVGAGRLKTVIYRDFTSGPTWDIGKASDAVINGVALTGVQFQHNHALTLGSGTEHVKARSMQNCVIDVKVTSCVEGVRIVGGDDNQVHVVGDGDYSTLTSHFGLKLEKCASVGTGVSALPTDSVFDLWITGPRANGANAGSFAYPLWITGAESNTFRGYWGQGFFCSTLIEQGSDNALIIDNSFDQFYIDAANRANSGGYGHGVAVFGAGVPAAMTWDSVARTGGDGSQYIGNTKFGTGTIKGQSGDGLDGIYIDPTTTGRTGTYAQACRNLIVSSGCVVSAWGRHGVNGAGGVGTRVAAATVCGNNLAAASGSGVVVGASSTRMQVVASRIGGDPYGSNPGAQLYGVQVIAGATGYLVGADNDLTGNATGPYTDAALSGTVLNRTWASVLAGDSSVLTSALATIAAQSLGPGTYLVTAVATFANTSATTAGTAQIVVNTSGGTATVTGPHAAADDLQSAASAVQRCSLTVTAQVTVTATTTLQLQAAASAGTMVVKSGDATSTGVSGLTILQIA